MSKYIIYKIYSEDCDYIYVGSTKNFTRRKHNHKASFNDNVKCNRKLYKTINEYGGWDNWKMISIEECDETIKSRRQAEQKEEEWRVKLNAQLNSQRAYISEEQRIENNKISNKLWRENNEEYYKKVMPGYNHQMNQYNLVNSANRPIYNYHKNAYMNNISQNTSQDVLLQKLNYMIFFVMAEVIIII